MKKLTKLILMGMLAFAGSAYAVSFGSASKDVVKTIEIDGKNYEYVFGTASKSGKYYSSGKTLAYGLDNAVVADTNGSWQNMELLAKGFVNVAFVQADVYNLWLSKNQEFKSKLLASGTDRKEYVQLIMRKGMDEDDLQSEKAKVYVGTDSSGGAGSWRNMCLLEKGYSKASIYTGDYSASTSIAFNKLKSKEFDALVITSYITPKTDYVQKVAKDKNIYFADVNDRDLNDDIVVNGVKAPIYTFEDAPVEDGFFSDKKVETIATEVLLVINTDLMSTMQMNKLLDVFEFRKSSLFK